MKISVIIVSYNTRDLLKECLDAVEKCPTEHSLEVFVIDNASSDGSAEMVADNFPHVKLLRNSINRGFAPACNQVQDQLSGDYILLLNSDAVMTQGAVDRMVAFMESEPSAGICGAQLLNDDGSSAPSARTFPSPWDKLELVGLKSHESMKTPSAVPYECDWVVGAFLLIRHKTLTQLGFFDRRFYFYFDEADLCRRAKQLGWKTYYLPDVQVPHHVGASGKENHSEDFNPVAGVLWKHFARSEKLYFRKHYGWPGILTITALEFLLLPLIWLKNSAVRTEHQRQRKEMASKQLAASLRALKETKWGTSSPPPPW